MSDAVGGELRSVVLVEGVSDQRAVEALAARGGRSLLDEGVAVLSIGGATSIRTYLERFGPAGLGLRLSGLVDVGEEDNYRRRLERAGLGTGLDRAGMERLGFYVCEADLEDELIRALGVDAVERIVAGQGELTRLRTFQQQPAQRGRPAEAQLRRFLGTRAGRKIQYAPLLVEALDDASVPRPLQRLLEHLSA